jgi:K+-dependent Na+/Ca+ exchanger-like protein
MPPLAAQKRDASGRKLMATSVGVRGRLRFKRTSALGWQALALLGMCGAAIVLPMCAELILSKDQLEGARRLSGGCGDKCADVPIKVGPVLDVVLMLYVFIGLAVVCDDFFMESLEKISAALKLTPAVAGATFLAAGSSAPELFTSVASAFFNPSEAGIGTIVGSAMFNLLIIVALSAVVASQIGEGGRLKVDWRPLTRDSFFYCMSIGLLALFFGVIGPGEITWPEGLIMVVLYGLYILTMVFNDRLMVKMAGCMAKIQGDKYQVHPEGGNSAAEDPPPVQVEKDPEKTPEVADPPPHVFRRVSKDRASAVASLGGLSAEGRNSQSPAEPWTEPPQPDAQPSSAEPTPATQQDTPDQNAADPGDGDAAKKEGDDEEGEDEAGSFWDRFQPPAPEDGEEWSASMKAVYWSLYILKMPYVILMSLTIPDCSLPMFSKCYWVTFFMSIVWIAGLCWLMVEFAIELGSCTLKMSPVIMGVLFLSIGTSVPDAIGSMFAAREGEADMAIANAIGSNVFDILLGLGLPWFLVTLINGDPFPVNKDNVILPVGILFVTVMLFFAILVATKFWMTKWMGFWLTIIYVIYMIFTIVAAKTGISGGC